MELVYLWVEDYKNIHRQGFNFSPRFNCNYDPKSNELTIDKNDDCIENFFGDNINVTAIVGKNGSGKSSVLEYLKYGEPNYYHSCSMKLDDGIYYFEKEVEGEYISRENQDFFIYFKNDNLYIVPRATNKTLKIKSTNRLILLKAQNAFSSIINFNQISEESRNLDIFVKNLIEMQVKYANILSEISKDKYSFNMCLITLGNHFVVNSCEFGTDIMEREIQGIYSKIEINTGINGLILKNIFSSYLLSINKLYTNEGDDSQNKMIIIQHCRNSIRTFLDKNTNIDMELIYSEWKNLLDLLDKLDAYLKQYFFNQIKGYEYLESIQDRFVLDKKNNTYIYTLDFTENNIDRVIENFYNIQHKDKNKFTLNIDFIQKNNNTKYSDLSKGEQDILKIIVDILYFMSLNNNTVVIGDEIDNFLHPVWKKELLNIIINIFNYFPEKIISFIFTTHSPFLLSDIPKQNIIFLDKDADGKCKVVDGLKEKKQTFGANIHTLLSDSFFMDGGLMGEFAKGKIDKAIKYLNQEKLNEEELKYCEQIISIIGEPIVKNQLQRMLDSKRLKKVDEIDAIKQSMEVMQKRLDELEND